MGKAGARSAPTALKVVRGDRASRVNKREPKPDPKVGEPGPPEWLSDEAVEIWVRLAPDLAAKGVLTVWDLESFAVFCDACITYREAIADVRRTGILVKTRYGNTKNPALQIVRDQAQVIRGFAQEFGLTPSARSGIVIPEGEKLDDARRLLS